MKNIILKNIIICLMALALVTKVNGSIVLDDDIYERVMKQDILCLMLAYPEYITNLKCDENDNMFLIMKSGKKILYDDKRKKTFEEKIANPDIQDMMEQIYPLYYISKLSDKNFDPGRARVYPLLSEVYGKSSEEVQCNLISVVGLRFNCKNKAAESLKLVMQELMPLSRNSSKISSCLYPNSGTFNYRYISGTNRLSPHAYGIAIDLARDDRDYWKWATREAGEKRLASYSREVVEVFEKNNFIWGGKWGHFDILHFEYRPEIILKAKYFADTHNKNGLWYEGMNIEDNNIKNLIEKIEKSINKL